MSMQARLLRRKKWLTLSDAAKWLSAETSGEVTSRDVAQFALEGELSLHVALTSKFGKKLIPKGEEKNFKEAADAEPWRSNQNYFESPASERAVYSQLKELAGIFKVGVNTDCIQGMLLSWVQGYSQQEISDYYDDSWCVFDTRGDAWIVYEFGPTIYDQLLPLYKVPEINTLMVPRGEIEAFVNSLGDELSAAQPSGGEQLRALEALGLLAETVAKQAPKYQVAGKPNKAQIAEAMSKQAGEVYGMSKSKLQRLLTDALDAWEEKRR